MHHHSRAVFGDATDLVDIAQVEFGVDPLSEQIERHRYDVDISRALAVAEQSTLNTVGSSHQSQFCRRNGRAAVVVGMN